MREMRLGTKSKQARAQLVAALRAAHTVHTDHVADAFLQTPREVFVPVFYEQERRPGYPWMPRSCDWYHTEDEWLSAIYRDEPLVTLVTKHNVPISSSSAPSVMAMMLEAAEISLGMRILEIGTGSGFNTALLAALNRCPAQVYTIDVEENLVRLAEQRFHTHVGPVIAHIGDGRLGLPTAYLQYDRILVTASTHEIPAAWYDQLAPGGRLIMPLQGMLDKGGFLIIEKDAHGGAQGRFDARSLHFMPLRAAASTPLMAHTRSHAALLRQQVTQRIQLADDEMAMDLFSNWEFHWFLQWHLPDMRLTKGIVSQSSNTGQGLVTLTDQKETLVQLFLNAVEGTCEGTWSGSLRGNGDLWERVLTAYATWMEKGRPGIEAYTVEWDAGKQRFSLCGPCEAVL